MSDAGDQGLTPLQAFEAVMGFARRRGEPALQLALHASVPQVLHADLLQLLRINFVPDRQPPGVLETDVMCAPFCSDIGNGYFRFNAHARHQLLQQLDPSQAGRAEPRSMLVADFLLAYFERQHSAERSDTDPLYRSWLEIERWNALAFRDPDSAAEQLAAAVRHACTPGQISARLRVGTLAGSLSTPLVRYHRLLRYAAGVEAAHSGSADAAALLRALGDEPLEVGDVSLPPVRQWLQAVTAAAPKPAAAARVGTPAEAADERQSDKATAATRTPAPPMSTSKRRTLPVLFECQYTAYVSYAQADDTAWFNWVTQFRDELLRSLAVLPWSVPLPHLYMAGHEGTIGGAISEELTHRLASSFAFIAVVHDNYAKSEWCLKELEAFHSLYGDEGFRKRLYVIALSQTAMQRVANSPRWRTLFSAGDQVWLPFFDTSDPSRPLEIYTRPGLVAPAFRRPFDRLRVDLASKLERSAAEKHPPPLSSNRGVLMGAVPSDLSAAMAIAVARLRASGIEVQQLTQGALVSDFSELDTAGQLVLAFDDQELLVPSAGPGGHLALQRDAWRKKGKSLESLHWLDLRPEPLRRPSRGAAAWVEQQGLATVNIDGLVRVLGGSVPSAAPESVMRIYIESNMREPSLWETLGEYMSQRWDHLMAELEPRWGTPPKLRARGLPLDRIDSFDLDEADGIVLLWGSKEVRTIFAQIDNVESKLRAPTPGIVAYLTPPHPPSADAVPAAGWDVLRFVSSHPEVVRVVDEDESRLDRFLNKAWKWHQRREAGPTA
ncbi:toll/interleukin-1 receptor domain-containing protein [Variovorax sp. J22R115]|uniref:toll/interleukin-1 receptor domain-containing protein n=1 Tax=Variovorax sp. J22R115 TaxID=3053509 RepID=UPI0025759141|nr:toll/interleukin-1 receptor domain-containing protein [Variovorax sp. J22R115]MDM0048610.1 toll/interleukin-1 receptor domain-containing protein [Variovorax sp. J22R115]